MAGTPESSIHGGSEPPNDVPLSATPSPAPQSSRRESLRHGISQGDEAFLFACFCGYTWAQWKRGLNSWAWDHGYDIQKGRTFKWVCRYCITRRNPVPDSFTSAGLQNAIQHLYLVESISAPGGEKTRSKAQLRAETINNTSQQRLHRYLSVNPENLRDQAITNSMLKNFDRDTFHRHLMEWIVEENLPFATVNHPKLRLAHEYLNPCITDQSGHISSTGLCKKIIREFQRHKGAIIEALRASPGKIHVSFDGWRSGNHRALYGVVVFFRDEYNKPCKLVLGIPKVFIRHTGQNIATQIVEVLKMFGIDHKIGFLILDNAANMDTASTKIGLALGFEGKKRRGRCFGHQLNLSAKSLLFGTDVEAFETEISKVKSLSVAEHALYHRLGPVGKAHNLVVDIWRSDRLHYILLDVQRQDVLDFTVPHTRALCVILDNDTRWLSQLYMIRRLIKLRPYLPRIIAQFNQEWEDQHRSKRTGLVSGRAMARRPRILKEENHLNDHDWTVLEHTAAILTDYEHTVKLLEGDGMQRKRKGWTGSYGNIWDVIFGFEFLLGKLEGYKITANKLPDSEHFVANINLSWMKLDKYYQKLDETPLYYTAIALHPRFRWHWFEQKWNDRPEWIQKAKDLVQELWDTEYRDLEIQNTLNDNEPAQKRRKIDLNPLKEFIHQQASSAPISSTLGDEYEIWQSHETVNNAIFDPLAYWHERRHQYPRLSQMALDILTVQPLSAECERVFSAAGRITTSLRGALDAMIISLCQVLRSWLRAGVIHELDPVLLSPDKKDEINYVERMSSDELAKWATAWIAVSERTREADDEEYC